MVCIQVSFHYGLKLYLVAIQQKLIDSLCIINSLATFKLGPISLSVRRHFTIVFYQKWLVKFLLIANYISQPNPSIT